jgi:hypothetical protein
MAIGRPKLPVLLSEEEGLQLKAVASSRGLPHALAVPGAPGADGRGGGQHPLDFGATGTQPLVRVQAVPALSATGPGRPAR